MIYILILFYNERENLEQVVIDINKTLSNTPHTIVAIDDGSSDGSSEIMRKLQKRNRSIILLGYSINMGVGAALETGIDWIARQGNPRDIFVIMEADGTNRVTTLPKLISAVQHGADVVIASRYLPGAGYRNFPIQRRMLSVLANLYLRKRFPIPGVSDYTIFYRAYRVDVIIRAFDIFGHFGIIQSRGFVANAELLIKLSLCTQQIREVPFLYDYGPKRSRSKITILRTIVEYFSTINYLEEVIRKFRRLKAA